MSDELQLLQFQGKNSTTHSTMTTYSQFSRLCFCQRVICPSSGLISFGSLMHRALSVASKPVKTRCVIVSSHSRDLTLLLDWSNEVCGAPVDWQSV